MKRTVLLTWLAVATACAAQTPGDALSHVTVLTSPDARERAPERERIASELNQLVSYLHVAPQELPNIVVVYANPQTARVDGLPDNAKITVAKINFADSSLYQVWVTGAPSDGNTIQGLLWALNRHFELHMTAEHIAEVRDRVMQLMSGVVSASSLIKKHH